MLNKLSVIIHGSFSGNALRKILNSLRRSDCSDIEVVIAVYVADTDETKKICSDYMNSLSIRYVVCKDLLNPGYFNINRQIHTVMSAVITIKPDRYVIKLRNDQYVSWNKLLTVLQKEDYFCNDRERIVTTNCFTRSDRLYHPSDMFMCAWQPAMLKYFSMPFMQETHMGCQFYMLSKLKNTYESLSSFLISPESELFRHYLHKNEWRILDTPEDSYLAIKKYCYILNTWDIDLRWNKKRTPLRPAGALIYPHYFRVAPFAGAPPENAKCFTRADFNGKLTFKDCYYIIFSKFLWKFFPQNEDGYRIKKIFSFSKKVGKVVARVFPPLYKPLHSIYRKFV